MFKIVTLPIKSNSPAYWLGVVLSLLPFFCYANDYAAHIKQASIFLQNDSYVLSADIHYQLSAKATEALQNGVPLFWNLRVRVLQQRAIVWDKTLADKELRYRLQYHALLNMYRVRNEGNGAVYNFSTLSAALDLMSTIRDFRVLEKSDLAAEKNYRYAVKIDFVRDALPLPLRPMAYIDPQWYLSSDWSLWPLKK